MSRIKLKNTHTIKHVYMYSQSCYIKGSIDIGLWLGGWAGSNWKIHTQLNMSTCTVNLVISN
jgi:hypothetical protein